MPVVVTAVVVTLLLVNVYMLPLHVHTTSENVGHSTISGYVMGSGDA